MKHLQNLFREKNYRVDFDNRKRAVRELNTLFERGIIKVLLAPYGRHFTSKRDGKKYVARIVVGDYQRRILGQDSRLVKPYNILVAVGLLLQDKKVSESIFENFEITNQSTCSKCDGNGVIPKFTWFANGVCFDCLGSGVKGVTTIKEKNK